MLDVELILKTLQLKFTQNEGRVKPNNPSENFEADLIFAFGSTQLIKEGIALAALKARYPNAIFMGGSSTGKIYDTSVLDDTIIATLVKFEKTKIKQATLSLKEVADSYQVGKTLVSNLIEDNQNMFLS